jgi:hypothetical protein
MAAVKKKVPTKKQATAPKPARSKKPAKTTSSSAAKPARAAKPAKPTRARPGKPAAKAIAKKAPVPSVAAPKKPRVYAMSFASVYPLYLQKVEKKGRTQAELDEVIAWLTGYRGKALQRVVDAKTDFETFFAQAPRLNPNASLITGVVCGVRVETIDDPVMKNIRYLDKLVDELAKGKKMESILRQ